VDEFHSNSESLGVSCSSLQHDEEEQQQQLGHGITPHKFPNKSI
jgi:hypothetical protein